MVCSRRPLLASLAVSTVFTATSVGGCATVNAANGTDARMRFRIGPSEVARARQAIASQPWARETWRRIQASADAWAARPDTNILALTPARGAVFAFGAAGSPQGGDGSAGATPLRVVWDETGTMPRTPGQVQDADGRVYPSERYPDAGAGWRDPTGKLYYFVGRYNSEVVDRLRYVALPDLSTAWALTGDRRYAHTAALILDALAATYPTTTGHADYPGSHAESGRLGQDYYYVGEGLAGLCLAFSLIHDSGELDEPSVQPGLTRERNIVQNMLLNGADYCYKESQGAGYVGPDLSNGMANYHRGTLAVGVTLGIHDYVTWVLEGPFGLRAMLDNTLDRDGLYGETAVNYVNHALEIWIALAEDLRYCGVPHTDLFADRRLQNAMWFPNRKVSLAGHTPPFGDSPPDILRALSPARPLDTRDWSFLEHALASVSDADAPRFEAALRAVTRGEIARARAAASPAEARWLLFHVRPLQDGPTRVRAAFPGERSAFFDSKGIAMLRGGTGESARGVLMFYGPTLNHGHPDELGLNLVDHGYEWSYDLGKWGLGSKHTMSAWATRTAAHNAVVVDEKDQGGPLSGGTLEAFQDFGPVRVVRASSPCYRGDGVRRYRRTVVMVDSSEHPRTGRAAPAVAGTSSYYLDVFDVEGGRTHDLFWHSQGLVSATTAPLTEEEPGSLAGPEIDYGSRIGPDGDVVGITRESWAGDPPNGYGFVVGNRRAHTAKPFWVEWHPGRSAKPRDEARFRLLHLPVRGDTEVTVGRAPGLYPSQPPAGVLRVRAVPEDGVSCFVSLLEAYEGMPRIDTASATLRRGVLTVRVRLRDGGIDEIVMTRHGLPAQPKDDPLQERVWVTTRHGVTIRRFLVRGPERHGPGVVQTGVQRGVVVSVDATRCVLQLVGLRSAPPPGALITVGNPRCHKRSVYRVVRAARRGRGIAVSLDAGSLVVGRGTLEQDPSSPTSLPNVTPLPWARRLRGPSYTGLLTGKRLEREGNSAATRVLAVDGDSGQAVTVESSAGFSAGDRFTILDVQAGDLATIEAVKSGAPIRRQAAASRR